ncbi:MAG: Hsp70 family protein [Clostridium beijerinckii]
MGKIIGIDLGTTTSEIAYIEDGRPVIIANDKYAGPEKTIVPSVVTIKEDEIIVGQKAKRQIILKPECTVSEVKRLMGSEEYLNINGQNYLPQQISAMILKTLKEMAEEAIGEVSEAVITVPANFNDLQRKATKDAAEIAGLKVERIINEPTAAALAYGIDNLDKDANILVYDLGGGTFDCTVLEMFSGIMDVKASRGNNLLGGKDFDARIEEYIKNYISSATSIDINKLNLRKKSEIKDVAERAKKDLSVESTTEIILTNLGIDENGDPIDVEFELTRAKFDEITKDLINETEVIINETLQAAGKKIDEIDVVLAVGGSSRMLSVQKLLKEKFGDKVQKGINPDEAVALGAAVQAGIKSDEISSENGLIVTDACSYTLGIEIIGERFSKLIRRDSKLPIKTSQIYQTTVDDQTVMAIDVYQGEDNCVRNDFFIGGFDLEGIPMAPAGEEKVKVTFEYDLNEILKVSAEILSTGKVQTGVMSTKGLSKETIKGLQEQTFKNQTRNEEIIDIDDIEVVDDSWRESKLYEKVKVSVSLAEIKLPNLSGNTKSEIENILNKIKDAILSEDENKVEELDEKLTDILFEL